MILLKFFENNCDNGTGRYLENAGTFYILFWRKNVSIKGLLQNILRKISVKYGLLCTRSFLKYTHKSLSKFAIYV